MRVEFDAMKQLPRSAVTEAFALSNARGAELLARLGTYRVWRGDLATMRNDNPRMTAPADESGAPSETGVLLDTIVLARAIELLQPVCRAALWSVYAEQKDSAALAADLETDPAYAQRILTRCEQRLLEIYDSLSEDATETATMPQWVSEREKAAAAAGRRR
jgi:hypothetical protein